LIFNKINIFKKLVKEKSINEDQKMITPVDNTSVVVGNDIYHTQHYILILKLSIMEN